jgi:subtilisin family serine protease
MVPKHQIFMKQFLLLLICLCVGMASAQFAPTLPTAQNNGETNELLLVVPSSLKATEYNFNLLASWGYEAQRAHKTEFSNITITLFSKMSGRTAKTAREAVSAYMETVHDGSYLVPNIKMYAFDLPGDPCFNRLDVYKDKEGNPHDILLQWDLRNTGQCGGVSDADAKAPAAWNELGGNLQAVIVAVIDTGVDVNHPNLASRIYKKDGNIVGTSFIANTTYADDHGHGTHCAGSIAGVINDQEGTAGMAGPAPVFIMPIKALSKEGSGDMQAITNAMKWAGQNGAHMVSMSLGAVPEGWQEFLIKMLFDDVLNSAEMQNVVSIAAAGNNGKDVHAYPAFCDKVMAIAAYSPQDQLASFSNFGTWVDVASPGVNIVSARAFFGGKGLDMYRSAGYDKCDFTIGTSANEPYESRKYYIASGTSMACPNAVGVAAMMKAVNPGLTTAQICQIMIDTSDKKEIYTQKIKGGRINAVRSVQAARLLR